MVTLANATHRDPEILSGNLVFIGTRVPVRSLFDYLVDWLVMPNKYNYNNSGADHL